MYEGMVIGAALATLKQKEEQALQDAIAQAKEASLMSSMGNDVKLTDDELALCNVKYSELMIMKAMTDCFEKELVHRQKHGPCYYVREPGEEGRSNLVHLFEGMKLKYEAALLLSGGNDDTLYSCNIDGKETSLSLCSLVNFRRRMVEEMDDGIEQLSLALRQYRYWQNHQITPLQTHSCLFIYQASIDHWCLGILRLSFDRSNDVESATVTVYDPLNSERRTETALGRSSLISVDSAHERIRQAIINTFEVGGDLLLSCESPRSANGTPLPKLQRDVKSCGPIVAQLLRYIVIGNQCLIFELEPHPQGALALRKQLVREVDDEKFSYYNRYETLIDDNIAPAKAKAVHAAFSTVLEKLDENPRYKFAQLFDLLGQARIDNKDHIYRCIKHYILGNRTYFNAEMVASQGSLFALFYTADGHYQETARDCLADLAQQGFKFHRDDDSKENEDNNEVFKLLYHCFIGQASHLGIILLEKTNRHVEFISCSETALKDFNKLFQDTLLSEQKLNKYLHLKPEHHELVRSQIDKVRIESDRVQEATSDSKSESESESIIYSCEPPFTIMMMLKKISKQYFHDHPHDANKSAGNTPPGPQAGDHSWKSRFFSATLTFFGGTPLARGGHASSSSGYGVDFGTSDADERSVLYPRSFSRR